MWVRGLLTAATLAFSAAPAHAVVLIDSAGKTPQPYQRWADQAHVPKVPGAVKLYAAPCPWGGGSCTGPELDAVWIDRTPGLVDTTLEFRAMFLHELGHRFDYQMAQQVRDHFQTIMRDRRPWRAKVGGSPSERFAEAYAICGLGGKLARSYAGDNADKIVGAYGYRPTPRQNRAVCGLLRSQPG